MTTSFTDVLVVIPCLNEARTLPRLLRQMLEDTGVARIVVADGGSTDNSRDVVADFATHESRVILLDNPARIQSAGVNLAVRTYGADARWLLRVDAHCDYPPGYLQGACDAAGAHGASAVVVPMVSKGEACFQRASAAAQNSWIGTGGSPHRHVGQGAFVDHGHHCLIDRALFERVGGYREDMSHNEDAELDLRLIAAGGRIWLEPSLALTYYPRGTARGLWRQYWGYGRGRRRTQRIHGARPKLRQLLPLAVPLAAVVALLTPVHWVFAVPVLLWALASLGAGVLVGARAGGGCAMAAGVAAMIMHMAWGGGYVSETLIPKKLSL